MQGSLRKRGGFYYYRITVYINGKPRYIERKAGKTKAEAGRALRAAIAEYEGTGDIKENVEILFEEYLDYWFKNYVVKELRFRTQEDYRNKIYKHFIPYFKNYKLKAITPALLQKYLYDKKESGLSKCTLEGHKGTLNAALKMAVYPYRKLTENPMQFVKLPKYETKKEDESEKIITAQEWAKIQKRFPVTNHFGLFLHILYYTALRESECCGLTWENIDLENKILKVDHQLLIKSVVKNKVEFYFAPPKTDNSFGEIILGDNIVEILKKAKAQQEENQELYGEYYTVYYKDKNNRIYSLPASASSADEKVDFVNVKENGEFVNQNTLKYCARVIHNTLKIKHFTFHRLRHTHASILISNGANMKAVQNRLRHSLIATTMNTYSHLLKKVEEDTAQLFDDLNK